MGAGRANSAPGVVIVIGIGEGFDRFVTMASQQDFDLLLRRAKRGLTLARECHATFESLESLFERHVAFLEPRDERFEFGQRLFEVG